MCLCGEKNQEKEQLHKIVYTFVIHYNDIMKTLSLKLEDYIFKETEQMTEYLKKSRNRYINDALDHYNKVQRKRMLAQQIEMESRLVAQDSMETLEDFEEIEDESQAI